MSKYVAESVLYAAVLYAAYEGLRGRNVLQLLIDLLFCYIRTVFAHNQFAYMDVLIQSMTIGGSSYHPYHLGIL